MKIILIGLIHLAAFLACSSAQAQFGTYGIDPNAKWSVTAGPAISLQSAYQTGWGLEGSYLRHFDGLVYGSVTEDFYKISLNNTTYTSESYWSFGTLLGLTVFLAPDGIQPYVFGQVGITNLLDVVTSQYGGSPFNGYEIDPLACEGVGLVFPISGRYSFALRVKLEEIFANAGTILIAPLEIGMDF